MARLSAAFVSPEDQSATFVELFFDLVFVFAVTRIVGRGGVSAKGSVRGRG